MELYLQQGSQMRSLGCAIAKAHPGTKIILSPKDFKTEAQLVDYAVSVKEVGGEVLLDPQLFLSKLGTEAARLPNTSYWTKIGDVSAFVAEVLRLNDQIGTCSVILPAPYIKEVNENSVRELQAIVACSREVKGDFLSVCLSGDFFRSERQYNRLCKFLESVDVPGVYLLPEHVDDDYLTDDPVWLHRLLEFCSDLKMAGKTVLVGYANHQLLPLACTAVDAMAAGKNRSTRIFWMNSFKKLEEGDVGFARPKPSFYCPHALTEFSLKYMDLAATASVLELMKPVDFHLGATVERMLTSDSPLSSGYSLPDGYLNYFSLLKQQCEKASAGQTFLDRLAWQRDLIKKADELLSVLHKHRVRGLLKDFSKYIGVAKSALQSLEETRGENLKMMDELFEGKKK